ncbi:MAG: DNA/RNA nuclease SfsA [Gemmatimonadota bacterium]|nr:MAG: DNA/RNA nuclease SfsA [Gemmatimonadota bacterium]
MCVIRPTALIGRAGDVLVVQGRDAASVTAARAIDPNFADALLEAHEAGVRLLGYRCDVGLKEARINEPVPVILATDHRCADLVTC